MGSRRSFDYVTQQRTSTQWRIATVEGICQRGATVVERRGVPAALDYPVLMIRCPNHCRAIAACARFNWRTCGYVAGGGARRQRDGLFDVNNSYGYGTYLGIYTNKSAGQDLPVSRIVRR